MTTVVESCAWLRSRSGRRRETCLRRGLGRSLCGRVSAGSNPGAGNALEVTSPSLLRDGPSGHHRELNIRAYGFAGSSKGRCAPRDGDGGQPGSRLLTGTPCFQVRIGVSQFRRCGPRDVVGGCDGRRCRTGHVDGAPWRVEGAEEVCPDVTTGPNPDTADEREETTAPRAEVAPGFVLTGREFQRATPRRELTTALARPDTVLSPRSQPPKTGSQRAPGMWRRPAAPELHSRNASQPCVRTSQRQTRAERHGRRSSQRQETFSQRRAP